MNEERFYEAYIDYLRERVGESEKAQPEAFAAFIKSEALKWGRLVKALGLRIE